MRISKVKARRAAYFFLTLLGGAFIALSAYSIYLKIGPRTVELANVPFGLPGGTAVLVGDSPDTLCGTETMPPSTKQELKRASALESSGKFEDAAEVYEAIALQYPDAFRAQWGVVNSLLSMDSLSSLWSSQLETMGGLLKKRYPESSVVFYIDARLAQKANSDGTALELARLAAEKAPALADARLLYADLLYGAGRFAECRGEAKAAISLSLGNDPRAYVLLSRVYHDEGVLDSCELVVEYALSKFPVDANLLCLSGYLQEYKGKFEDAENTYRRVLAIRPGFKPASAALLSLGQKSPPGVLSGGSRLTPRDRAEIAYGILEPLVAQYPDNLPLREALGRAYLKGRDFDRARGQFSEIQNRDPDYPEIQLRLQEAASAPSVREAKQNILASNLSRAIDSMRTLPTTEHSFESSLGHYLVRYGASQKEFFSKYSAANFKKLSKNAWQEIFYEAPYFHRYTVLFDDKGKFYGVHGVVTDSNVVADKVPAHTPEIWTTMFQLNARLSGVGSETGETDCSGTVMKGATWETRDNFEMLARIAGRPAEVRLIRLDRSKIPDGTRLCDYLKYLLAY